MTTSESTASTNDQPPASASTYGACHHVTFPSKPHALPFRTILSEYFVRRPRDLARVRADVHNVPHPDPFNKDAGKSRSAWGKFGNQQWRQLQTEIKASETAYQNLADEKEKLAALSAADAIVLLGDHRRRIKELTKEIGALDSRIVAAPLEEKPKLESDKKGKEEALSDERAKKKADKLQKQIAEGYKKVLDAEQKCKEADKPLLQVLHGMSASAVCRSGGGIRSASFCLGVLQGLARFSIKRNLNPNRIPALEALRRSALEGLDYLSTVSGGGYIGSWLMAWATRDKYSKVVELLAKPAGTAGDPEPQPIRHLREYTSYLTPRYGFTLDTITVLTILVRNLLLNWMILVPALVFVFCIPVLFYQAFSFIPLHINEHRVFDWSLVLASLFASCATFFIAQSTFRPPYASETKDAQNLGRTSREVGWLILPLLAGAWLMSVGWAWAIQKDHAALADTLIRVTLHFAWFAIAPPMVMAFTRVWWQLPRMGLNRQTPLRRDRSHREPGESDEQEPPSGDSTFASFLPFGKWVKTVDWWKLAWALVAPLLIALLIALALAASARYIPLFGGSEQRPTDQATHMFVWLSLPLIWSALLLASAFLSGLLSGIETEEEREWWARAGGLIIMFMLGWIALFGLAFYGGTVVSALWAGILAAAGLAAGSAGSLAGLSAATSAGLKKVKLDQLTAIQKWLSKHDLFAPAACAIAIICLSFALAAMTSGLRQMVLAHLQSVSSSSAGSLSSAGKSSPISQTGVSPATSDAHLGSVEAARKASDPAVRKGDAAASGDINEAATPIASGVAMARGSTAAGGTAVGSTTANGSRVADVPPWNEFVATLYIALIAIVIAVLANGFVNVNTFSLHGMYRMRLTRAYLGASNFARHPDNFTNFDPRDNPYEAYVVRHDAPLHIINTTLNLVATTNLAWQQRKGESFTFSPISVGCWRLGYLPTSFYGGSKGVTLGTAMSISGAAFNPNMGYNSSPLVTLLMTFFNARLGWWLPNPAWPVLKSKRLNSANLASADLPSATELECLLRKESWATGYLRSNGPVGGFFTPLRTLINEALGRTDDKYKWIELTDGGHFENLGLYEMVMRRCQYIVLVDSDADGDFEFEDLGNALRKIEIDFGVPIRFPKYPSGLPMKRGIDGSNVYYALGDIYYDCVDSDPESSCSSEQQGIHNGKILYIKPCLNGSEPQGIRAYAKTHSDFPHESTINQFFNEAQFESYRSLGSWEFASIVDEFSQDPDAPGNDIQTLFDIAESTVTGDWTSPPKSLWETIKDALGLSKEERSAPAAKPPNRKPSPAG